MSPELHRQMIDQRASELRREAAEYRRAREARQEQDKQDKQDKRSSGERRRSLFGRIASA
ncbi:hypothetical protein [Streptosporangium carneum]|uniref:Uncharacterized protein n=1 Tax=Streptosporangium carneum TaxID=47481 RepID=A0A9W6ME16_9ACTN|nr:hypothetical protein [Streptosporangium carneum]GLK10662.1 hypothetical protein GCM10017600_40680 [Streptosporangium carneum]